MQPSWRGRYLLRNDHPPTLRSACRSHDTDGACVYRLISVGAQTSSCYQDDFLDLSTELISKARVILRKSSSENGAGDSSRCADDGYYKDSTANDPLVPY